MDGVVFVVVGFRCGDVERKSWLVVVDADVNGVEAAANEQNDDSSSSSDIYTSSNSTKWQCQKSRLCATQQPTFPIVIRMLVH